MCFDRAAGTTNLTTFSSLSCGEATTHPAGASGIGEGSSQPVTQRTKLILSSLGGVVVAMRGQSGCGMNRMATRIIVQGLDSLYSSIGVDVILTQEWFVLYDGCRVVRAGFK